MPKRLQQTSAGSSPWFGRWLCLVLVFSLAPGLALAGGTSLLKLQQGFEFEIGQLLDSPPVPPSAEGPGSSVGEDAGPFIKGWRVMDIHPGPACEVSFDLVAVSGEAGAALVARIDTLDAPLVVEGRCEPPCPGAFDEVVTVARGRLEANGALGLLRRACVDERFSTLIPSAELEDRFHARPGFLVLCLLLSILGAWFARRPATPAVDARSLGPSGTKDTVWVAVVGLGAMLVSLVMAATNGIFPYELDGFGAARLTYDAAMNPGSAVSIAGQPPLSKVLLFVWLALGDVLGLGGQLLWLRLPNVLLWPVLVVLFSRLASAWLGRGKEIWVAATLLFLLIPVTSAVGLYQGNYFMELVASVFFLERLATFHVGTPPRHATVAFAAALVPWTGYLGAFIVAPGFLAYLIATWRREGPRPALFSLLLFTLLLAPLLAQAFSAAVRLLGATVSVAVDGPGVAHSLMRYRHVPVFHEQQLSLSAFLSRPLELLQQVYGAWVGGGALALCLVFALRKRAAGLGLFLVLMAYAGLSVVHVLRWQNYSSLYPLLVLAPLGGLVAIPPLQHRRWLRGGFLAVWVTAALASSLGGFRASPFGWAPLELRAGAGEPSVLEVSSSLLAPEHAQLPLLAVMQRSFVYYYVCPHRASAIQTYEDCLAKEMEPGSQERRGARRRVIAGREVLVVEQPWDRRNQEHCAVLRGESLGEPWAVQEHLVFVEESEGLCPTWLAGISARCLVVIDMKGATLYRCPAPWASSSP